MHKIEAVHVSKGEKVRREIATTQERKNCLRSDLSRKRREDDS